MFVFVDTPPDFRRGVLRKQPLSASEDREPLFNDRLDPTASLAVSPILYGAAPEAAFLTVSAESFGIVLCPSRRFVQLCLQTIRAPRRSSKPAWTVPKVRHEESCTNMP